MTSENRTAQHSPAPWHVCCGGKCSCFTVMADDYPVAHIEHGEWGDTWPEVRIEHDGKPEAYIEKMVYGEIGESTARANWHLIAAAPDLLAAAVKALNECCDLIGTDAGNALIAAIAKAHGSSKNG